MTTPQAATSAPTAARSHWTRAGDREHFVQFYEDDAVIVEAVGGYVERGLTGGAAGIVIATPSHREQLERLWEARGVDVAAVRASGQYVPLDAAATLDSFLVDGWPDAGLFEQAIAPVVSAAAARHARVVAFGEMVALLWEAGRHAAAVHLEELWNELSRRQAFSLFCAYPLRGDGEVPPEMLARVCGEHAHAVPSERFTALAGAAEQAAAICQLQHEALRLQSVIRGRRAVEAMLADRERELADFAENAPHPLHSVGRDGRILWANAAELELLGYAADEYVGHEIQEFHVDADAIGAILRRLQAGETLRGRPSRMRRRDGSILDVVIDSNAVWEDGVFVRTRCFTRDVTELRRAERARRRVEEQLRASDRRKDEFLAMLGHELRNPLAPIRNATDVLRRTADGHDGAGAAVPHASTARCRHMTRLRRRPARRQPHHAGQDPVPHASRSTCWRSWPRAVETSRPLIDARRHRLTVALPERRCRVDGDPTRLVQVVANLLNNAAKYTPEGGEISVDGRSGPPGDERRVRCACATTASASRPSCSPRVFDMFVQADRTLERSQGGLGIGLTLVRSIVELHGGTVRAHSDGAGPRQRVRASACRCCSTQPPAGGPRRIARRKLAERAPASSRRVLIVDDNIDAAESLAMLLRLSGHRSWPCTDGPDRAGDAAVPSSPTSCCSTSACPASDGYEVARRLRAAGCTATLAALTGYGQAEDRQRSFAAGIDHHFVKPVDVAEVQRLLD